MGGRRGGGGGDGVLSRHPKLVFSGHRQAGSEFDRFHSTLRHGFFELKLIDGETPSEERETRDKLKLFTIQMCSFNIRP